MFAMTHLNQLLFQHGLLRIPFLQPFQVVVTLVVKGKGEHMSRPIYCHGLKYCHSPIYCHNSIYGMTFKPFRVLFWKVLPVVLICTHP